MGVEPAPPTKRGVGVLTDALDCAATAPLASEVTSETYVVYIQRFARTGKEVSA